MTTDEIRIAMAELEGWYKSGKRWISPEGILHDYYSDFTNDLNAVHRVEAKFVHDPDWCRRYEWYLMDDDGAVEADYRTANLWHADAMRRCGAILKTQGKWKQ